MNEYKNYDFINIKWKKRLDINCQKNINAYDTA